jgi:very-short-patch-repair endonuclease
MEGISNIISRDIYGEFTIKTERGIKYYDGLVIGTNILLESDGDRYHRTPEELENDAFKTMVAKREGYRLIRFKHINSEKIAKKYLENIENFKELLDLI